MMKIMDIIFAILHLDIERTTEALLTNVIPSIIYNRQGYVQANFPFWFMPNLSITFS